MKIVEFGDDGSPRLLKQRDTAPARDVPGSPGGVKIREFPAAAPSSGTPQHTVEVGRIKIREFGKDANAGPPQKASNSMAGPFGAARVPQSIKIVDFDREKGRMPSKPAPAQGNPRGMKIVETE